MRFFWLYRVPADAYRAQTIQVVHAAHAMASRGHEVWLPVDRGAHETPFDPLKAYDLPPRASLKILPLRRNPVGSLQLRAAMCRWAMRRGTRRVMVARSKRHAVQAVRWLGPWFDLFMEVHEVDSELARERGEDPGPWRALEGRVLASARGVFGNAEGTIACLQGAWPDWRGPTCVVHNATRPDRCRRPTTPGQGYGVVGSALPAKGLDTVAEAARKSPHPIHWVGPPSRWQEGLTRLSHGQLCLEGPVPFADVPDRLARFRAVILPLGTGLFGTSLTSPLKLWDYLVCGRPMVVADTPAARQALPQHELWYQPGDSESLLRALERAEKQPFPVAHRLRTWADRAAEMERFIEGCIS